MVDMRKLVCYAPEGGGGDGAGAGAAPAAAESTAPEATAKNPLANVRYGKQVDDTQEAPAQPDATPERDMDAEFEAMIKGEFRDSFNKRTQGILDSRFKQTKQQEAMLNAMQPAMDALASKYGMDISTPDGLQKLTQAIEGDSSFFEDEADRLGVTPKQLQEMRKLERENAQFRQAALQRERQQRSDAIFNQWSQQEAQAQQAYPGMSLQAEVNDPTTGARFSSLLRNGVDVKTAYEVVHKDELIGGAIQYAVKQTQQRVTDNIRARGMRPSENGTTGSAATQVIKSDPSKWTKKDREEIHRRVMRGERIEL